MINSTSAVFGQTRLAVNVSKEKSQPDLLIYKPAYNKAKCKSVLTLDNRILQGESECALRAGVV